VGQAVLARRSRAVSADKKALLDDCKRLLVAYLEPLLDPPTVRTRRAPVKAPPIKRAR
jgi:hypothetical protein